jgi:predicted transposase/invertase (TIGR01784 family)
MADVFVRYLLGSEENKDILIDFLNAVFVQKGYDLVVEINLLNPFNLKTIQASKESILDVKAKDSRGRWINIEVQIDNDGSYANRSLYYWAKSYSGQLKSGETYGTLDPAVCINLLDFEIFPQLPGYHNCFQVTEIDQPEYVLSEHLQIHFIELPKNQIKSTDEVKNDLDRWCFYFENEGSVEEEKMTVLLKENEAMGKAHKVYSEFTASDELMDMVEAREKWQRDVNSKLLNAKEEGMQQGMQRKAREDAQKMLDRGFSVEDIMDITGLSEQEIKDIQKK